MKSNEETLNSNTNDEGDTSAAKPTICSLASLQVLIPDDIRDHLARQYQGTHCFDQDAGTILQSSYKRVDQILLAMKTPPSGTTCRVNLIHGSRQDIQKELEAYIKKKGIDSHFEVKPHPEFSDVLCIDQKVKEGLDTSSRRDLTGPKTAPDATPVFPSWSSRSKIGWPIAHRAVLVDRFCGEAVLRGSHIFVRGILAADKGIQANEIVAVFADVHSNSAHLSGKEQAINRGLSLEQYKGRTCVYLGLGTSQYNRSDLFRLEKGVGVQMLLDAEMRVGPVLPPVHGILKSKIFFQNLPSMVVAHALAPQRGETIIDMCAAPGGKTSHIASLVQNNATIVACDVSRRKMLLVKAMVQEMGATCITPIALNTTDCVIKDQKREEGGALKQRTVKEVLESSPTSKGLLKVSGFYPESFDRILLDPPCSALGLRPKLKIAQMSLKELQQVSLYQRKFVHQAVALLKPGGIMTYSTCTFHADENERMVRYILDEYPSLELLPAVPQTIKVGKPGLAGMGLTDIERSCVRRFDPDDHDNDTIGFFVAKFKKKK